MKRTFIPVLLFAFAQASLAQLSGPLSGTLGPGTYHVIDTISINASDTLRLLPGTTFMFDGGYPFRIRGTLLATGTESDSIIFTTDTLTNPDRWRGLRFSDSTSSRGVLAYCLIENGSSIGESPDDCGGALFLGWNSSPAFANCIFQGNRCSEDGGAIYCIFSSATFLSCKIRGNTASDRGGAIYCNYSWPTFDSCRISENSANTQGGGLYCLDASPTLTDCAIKRNTANISGGGLSCESSWANFLRCALDTNNANEDGGGMSLTVRSSCTFRECTVSGNRAGGGGGGLYSNLSRPTFSNCTFGGNWAESDGGAIHCDNQSSAIFENCLIIANGAGRWGGAMYCYNRSSPSLSNCRIVCNFADSHGGGVVCAWYCDATLAYCTVRDNQGRWGGGSFVYESSPAFTNCEFGENSSEFGGAVYCENSSSDLTGCIIENNRANVGGGGLYVYAASANLVNCTICSNTTDGDGGGLEFRGSQSTLSNCTINDNSSDAFGGGVSCHGSGLEFRHCRMKSNDASRGGGLFIEGGSTTLQNCTLVGNSAADAGGIYLWNSSPVVNSSVIALSQGPGIFFWTSAGSQIRYCDFFGNLGGNFNFPSGDSSHGPLGIGQLMATNANGDSCDVYHNIFLDPMFVDTAAGDFHLLASSPCIDAGDPALPYDPDSTIADIGAFYFHQLAAEPIVVLMPKVYALHPNWPNPFNTTTMIRYDVPTTGTVSLTIFNLLGQRVTTLFDGRQLAGTYTVQWDAANLPSGVYLCRMEAQGFVQTRKMVFVK